MDTTTIAAGLISIVGAYLVGGIPWGVVLARLVGGPDPRSQGSGRTGGANVLRVLGPRVAAGAAVLDLLKGCVAALLPVVLGAGLLVQAVCVLVAIIGHSRSPYIGFRGGRGVSPAFGSLLVLWPLVALIAVPVFLGVIRITHYSSLGSLTATTLAGLIVVGWVLTQGLPPAHLVYAIGAPALIWYFHRDNV
ncbi:MAG: glycerol-3-phosphate acyltransferase, partial [Candidatus Limnocylindrales bacterium]